MLLCFLAKYVTSYLKGEYDKMEQAVSQSKSPFATEPIGRLIVKFAVPCVISLLVNSLYNIVD